jgi:phospholipid-binding lipoprotein MlaA
MRRVVTGLLILLLSAVFSLGLGVPHRAALAEEGEEEYVEEMETISDPLEKFNRLMYTFNDKVYFNVVEPVAKGYAKVVPAAGRRSVKRFFANARTPIRLVNCTLQGKMRGAGVELARFAANTTLGVAGFLDPARSHLNLRSYDEDTDQTLGFYGMGSGFYIVWPFLGPSSARGTAGLVGDVLLDPTTWVAPSDVQAGLRVLKVVNTSSLIIGLYDEARKAALDPYIAQRNAYFQSRQNKVADASTGATPR